MTLISWRVGITIEKRRSRKTTQNSILHHDRIYTSLSGLFYDV
jgi:hypothetical protein